jgi:deoxyxylulose-5-phosphate synthase
VAVITLGPIGVTAQQAIAELSAEPAQQADAGFSVGGDSVAEFSVGGDSVATKETVAHYDLRFLKPLDEDMLHEIGRKFKKIVTVEDGVRSGGMGSAVMEWMADHGYSPAITRLGLPDRFVEHGTVAQLQHIVGIDKEAIKEAILKVHSS